MTLSHHQKDLKVLPEKIPHVFNSEIDIILYAFLFLTAGIVFFAPALQTICGPILAFLFVYLYFSKKDTITVTLFIILANDALGTVFFGNISFQYLLVPFVLTEIISRKKISVRSFFLALLAVVMIIQPCLTGVVPVKNTFITIFYVLALLLQYEKYEQTVFLERFKFSMSLIVGLIALHAVITGGVVFDQSIIDIDNIEGLRRGILGVGIGDPNFSGLLLCAGAACTLNAKLIHLALKIIIFVLCLSAMTATLSTAALIALLLVLLLTILLNHSLPTIIVRLCAFLVGIVLIYQVYLALPSALHTENIDAYIARMQSKVDALNAGDLEAATTNRSIISEKYWVYLTNEQSIARQIFGGNSLHILQHVPHNTYVDFLLQFGFLGTAFLIIYMLKRFFRTFFSPKDDNRKITLILKVLYAVFIFSVSAYTESTFALMFMFLFVF